MPVRGIVDGHLVFGSTHPLNSGPFSSIDLREIACHGLLPGALPRGSMKSPKFARRLWALGRYGDLIRLGGPILITGRSQKDRIRLLPSLKQQARFCPPKKAVATKPAAEGFADTYRVILKRHRRPAGSFFDERAPRRRGLLGAIKKPAGRMSGGWVLCRQAPLPPKGGEGYFHLKTPQAELTKQKLRIF